MPFSDRELFARLIKCEAGGEGDTGMRAVASVVGNRAFVSTGEFSRIGQGGNVRNIITQPGQFVCMRETVSNIYNAQNVYNMTPDDVHYEIADWAIAGNTASSVGNSLFFFNPYRPECPPNFPRNIGEFFSRIYNHCFYSPTEYYHQT